MPSPSTSALTAPLLALALALCSGCGGGEAPLGRPTVVLVVLDALHAEHVSHLGWERPTTPALDALAADGISFTSAFAPAPYTLASIPSLMTGRLPDTHGLTHNQATLVPEEATLAELMRDAGYTNLAAVANLNGSSVYGIDQGFQEFVELFRPASSDADDAHGAPGAPEDGFQIVDAASFPPVVARWLEENRGEEKLFLYAHVLEPHKPYDPPAEFRERFLDPAYDGRFREGLDADEEEGIIAEHGYVPMESRADVDAIKALYDANIAYADSILGDILELLKQDGRYEDALIIVTSDHGEALWQHRRWGHSLHLYDEMLSIPMVIKLPQGRAPAPELRAGEGALAPGTKLDALVSLIDVVPTLCRWLGLPRPEAPLDGYDLTEVLLDPDAFADRSLFLRTFHRIPHVGVRTPTRKTIVYRDPESGRVERVEQFRLDVDPGEQDDQGRRLDPKSPVVQKLMTWIENATRRKVRRERPLTDEDRAFLHRLGYVDDGEE